jgi:hypothetical protein
MTKPSFRHALAILLLAASATSASCGSDDPDLASVPGGLAQAVCGKIYQCCSAAERTGNALSGGDQKSCEATASGLVSLGIASVKSSVDKGRVVYHADKMSVCLEKLRALDCPAARMTSLEENPIPECAAAFEGKVALGSACADSGECVTRYCDAGGADEGKCAATKADGQPCQLDPECTNGECAGGVCGKRRDPPTDNLCK